MKRHIRSLALGSLALLAATPAYAVREYYSLGRSMRALGMGNAFFGVSDDAGAVFYNPAGLAFVRGGEKFTLVGVGGSFTTDVLDAMRDIDNGSGGSVSQLAQTLEKYQGTNLHLGPELNFIGFHRKNFALTFLVPNAKVNVGFLGKGVDTRLDTTAIADAGVLAALAIPIAGTRLAVGVTGKGIVRSGGRQLFTLDDIVAGNKFTIDPKQIGGVGGGIDFDLGAQYQFQLPEGTKLTELRAGVTLQNLLAQNFQMLKITGGAPPGLVRTVNFGGLAAIRGVGPISEFRFAADLAQWGLGGETDPDRGGRSGSFWKHVGLGVEAPMLQGYFVPRLGNYQGAWTAGFTLDFRAGKLDFATYAEELGAGVGRFPSRRLAARLEIGWGAAPPAPFHEKVAEPTAIPKDVPELKEDKTVPTKPGEGAPAPTGVPPLTPEELTPTTEGPIQGLPKTEAPPAPAPEPTTAPAAEVPEVVPVPAAGTTP